MKDLKKWLKEIIRWSKIEDFAQIVIDEGQNDKEGYRTKFRCRIYTHDHIYALVAIDRQKDEGYLGCTVSTRKPRAGEDWTRGNDLPDGPFTRETWQKIKNAIIAYELVKVAKEQKREGEEKKEVLPCKINR